MNNLYEELEAQEVAREEEEAYMNKVEDTYNGFPDDGVGNDGHRQD